VQQLGFQSARVEKDTCNIASRLVGARRLLLLPIVFVSGEDPVRLGLVNSLARPGGNMTGVNIFVNEVAAKRLELLRELVPTAMRVGVLVNPANTSTEAILRDVESAARAMGLQARHDQSLTDEQQIAFTRSLGKIELNTANNITRIDQRRLSIEMSAGAHRCAASARPAAPVPRAATLQRRRAA
jgi:hypothetical protein